MGVATLLILDYYDKLAHLPSVTAHREENDWDEIYRVYGALAPDVRRLNTPDTITDAIDPRMIEENWQKIVEIVRSVPTAADCRAAMHKAGCKLTPDEIGKSPDFIAESFRYHPYMRRRLSLKRVSHMLDLPAEFH